MASKRFDKRTQTYFIDYRANGKRKHWYVGPDPRQADKALKIIQGRILDGRLNLVNTEKTLSALIDEYLQYAKANNSIKSYGHSEIVLKKFFLPLAGNRKLTEVTPQLIEQFKQFNLKRGIKPSSVNRYTDTIQAVMNKAVEWGYLPYNPIKSVKKFKNINKRLPRFLTESEISKLLLICNEHHLDFYPALYAALTTGLRKSELQHVRWRDVDLERRQLKVENRTGWHTKSYKPRTIPINEKLAEVLNNLPRGNNDDAIFSSVNFRKLWEDTRKKAGLDCRFHDIRHTYASHLTMKGVPLNTVRELLGHSDLSMLQIYAHLTPDHLAEATEKLPY